MSGAGGDARRRQGLGQAPTPPKSSAASSRHARTVAIPIDAIADAAIAARGLASGDAQPHRCHVCNAAVSGDDATSGLFVWVRGDEIRFEEPPLCGDCGIVLGISALAQWRREEDDEE